MGEVIRFPVEGRRPYVGLCWDGTWSEYLIGILGRGTRCLEDSLEWCGDYDQAAERWVSMSERFGLPLIDLTMQVTA